MPEYPRIVISAEMIKDAKEKIKHVKVNRTQASKIDSLTGILGEYAFAQWFYGDWRKNNVGRNKGKTDFKNIEVKCSAYPFSERLNLLVREDYAQKRKPPFYVQIILDVKNRKAEDILPGTHAVIAGWADSAQVENAPLRDFGSKSGNAGNYRCRYISIKKLQKPEELKNRINDKED